MTLQEAIITWNKGRCDEVTAALRADAALSEQARAEIARLTVPDGGPRVPAQHDHISRERHRALTAMLATA